MAAKVNGILEPVVVEISSKDDSPESVSAGDVARGVGSAAAAGAAACSEGGPLAAAVCGVGAAIGAAFSKLADATRTNPDDARRFLYEVGYIPGRTLHTARVVTDVSAHDKLLIRRARYIEISDRSNWGRDTINGWLELAGETDGREAANPMPLETYFDHMADAWIARVASDIADGDDAPELPTPDAPDVHQALPLHRAILGRMHANEGAARAILIRLRARAPKFVAWAKAVQRAAGDQRPLEFLAPASVPHAPSSAPLWWFGAALTLGAGIGLALRRRRPLPPLR